MLMIFASDPHGTGQPWINLIEQAKQKYPDAQIVFGGDYIDGRSFSKETLEYVMCSVKHDHAIALLGNHEQVNRTRYLSSGLAVNTVSMVD